MIIMKYTFSIHGVPYGSQSWGDISDSEYLKSFYNSVSASNVPTQMIVDIRYSGDTICSYYHYLILRNVDDYESRPGSYFGMTVCFEGVYCSDFVELYNLFNTCFEKVVLNSILVKSGERYKYAFSDFDSANNTATLKRVDVSIRNNIPLFEHNLVAFPENFSPKHRNDGWIEKWSIDDIGNKTFVNILLRDSMASISPYYPVSYKKMEILQGDNRTKDSRIKALESDNGHLQNENDGLKNRISNQERDIESQGATIKNQNGVIHEQKGTITTLEAEKKRLENNLRETRSQIEVLKEELKQAQNNRDDETLQKCLVTLKSIAQKRAYTDQLIDAINPKLKKAEENIEQIDKQLNRKKSFKLTSNHFQLSALIIVAIIAILGVMLPTPDDGESPQEYLSISNAQGMIDESLNPIKETMSDISKELENMKNTGYSSPLTESKVDYDGDEVTYIAIDTDDDTEFYYGNTYTVKALKNGMSSDGKVIRQKLSKGGGQFIVQLTDGREIELESKDKGKTAQLSIGNDWPNSIDIIYRFMDTDVNCRQVLITKK